MSGNRKLGRVTSHRNLMLRGLVTYLFENGKIETTYARAKEVAAIADQMITLAKNAKTENRLAAYRTAMGYITKEAVAKKLFDEIAPGYVKLTSGYAHVYKLGPRRGDGAEMALVKLAEEKKEEPVVEEKKAAKKPATRKKAAPKKKAEEAAPVAEEAVAPVEEAAAPVEEPASAPVAAEEVAAEEPKTEETPAAE
ncbi:MAG: 50S ribosomal protein L17 [Clostridia bacterium]|nr:50S ribosomal protein L17 [Clostridia bacterium]